MKIYKTKFIAVCSMISLLLSSAFIANADVYPARTPSDSNKAVIANKAVSSEAEINDLLHAMGISAGDIAGYDIMGSDLRGFSIGESTLEGTFPTSGDAFAILSTGNAEDAFSANSSPSISTTLEGLNNSQGYDQVLLQLSLMAPATAVCAGFDFMFLSDEFPEFVGSSFNDTFTAELGSSLIAITENDVTAPNNFAFDTESNIVSINTSFGVSTTLDSTYDGKTPLLRATTSVIPGAENIITLSVMDLGDSDYDSSVLLDNFFWSTDSRNCSQGAQIDTDGDGLLDDWENNGLTIEINGVQEFLDLPSMGADPMHKDLFVEIDFMASNNGVSFSPKKAAIDKIIAAFAAAPVINPDGVNGIHLHVDGGSDFIMDSATSEKWGPLSKANKVAHDKNLGTITSNIYNWSEFQALKSDNFSQIRAAVFRYAIFAEQLGTSGFSGIARGMPSSDFIVSLGNNQSVGNQAGTFMHELGHTLSLRHGGEDDANYKPNYLSVMNYLFQFGGLITNGNSGRYDYSRHGNPILNEKKLNETVGLNAGTVLDTFSTIFYCADDQPGIDQATMVGAVNSTVDWNCDSTTQTSVITDINANSAESNLNSFTDWNKLVFTGGGIGSPGAIMTVQNETPVDALDETIANTIPITHAVMIRVPNEIDLNTSQKLSVDVFNKGALDDTYTINITTSSNSGNVTGYPTEIHVLNGGTGNFDANVESTQSGNEEITITITSKTNTDVFDEYKVTAFKTNIGNEPETSGGGGGSIDSIVILLFLMLLIIRQSSIYKPSITKRL